MAQLGQVFLNAVYADAPSRSVKITSRAVESGESVTDHVQKEQTSFSISGIITGKDSVTRMKKLEKYMYSGQVLNYTNRITASSVVIESFGSNHGVETKGGFTFDITLKQIKIAKATTVKTLVLPKSVRVKVKTKTKKGTQQKQTASKIKKTTKKATTKKKTSTTKKTTTKKKTSSAIKSKVTGMTPAQMAAANGNHVKK